MTPSIKPDNKFRFLCPVIGEEARYMACVFRKHRKWRGESVDCGACSAAMDANKCPAIHMIDMEVPRHGETRSIFYDPKGEKLYKIPPKVAERIENLVVLPYHCRRYEMTPEMHERLTGTTQFAKAMAQPMPSFKPTPATKATAKSATAQERPAGAKPTRVAGDLTDILDSATTDMAGAINSALS
jgi:hypothetical protein